MTDDNDDHNMKNYVVRMRNQTKSYKINLSLSALNLFILGFSKLSEPSVRLLGHVLLGAARLGLPGAGSASGAATGAALDCGVNNGGKLSHGNEDLHTVAPQSPSFNPPSKDFLDQWINGLTTHKFIFRDSTGMLGALKKVAEYLFGNRQLGCRAGRTCSCRCQGNQLILAML